MSGARAAPCLLIAALITGGGPVASAQEPGANVVEAGAGDSEPRHRLQWTYPTFRPVEYVVAMAVPIVFRFVDYNVPEPTVARWSGGNFFDDSVTSTIGDNDEPTRRVADRISTWTWYAARAQPFIDAILVPVLDDWNMDVAWQMTAINIGAYGVQAFVKLIAMRWAARHRPSTELCLERGTDPDDCLTTNTKSFPSGHTSSSFTGAGLTCAHHSALPLYGGGAADTAACVGALALATSTAVLRVIADKHHTSDVLVGAGLGLGAGWLLPWLLHYRYGPDSSQPEPSGGGDDVAITLVPVGDGSSSLGLGALGLF